MVTVAAALIWNDGKFMICQRPENKARGLKWEFVGGKTEDGETASQALIRECREELDITVRPLKIFMELDHIYPDIKIHLVLFEAVIEKGVPKLLEHNDLRWITPSEIDNFDFCPADEKILDAIKKKYSPVPMRRKDRQKDENFSLEVIDKCQYATLCMSDEALPYGVPISFVRDGKFIYFHSARTGRKCSILRQNPSVCLTFVGDVRPTTEEFSTEYQSAMVFGRARELSQADTEEKIKALRLLCEKYCISHMDAFQSALDKSLAVTSVWKISMDNISGKAKIVK